MYISTVINFLLPFILAVDMDCDFTQIMDTNREYYINNYEYPWYYYGGKICRWRAIGLSGTKIRLNCTDIDLVYTPNCDQDRLTISRRGYDDINQGIGVCGKRTLVTESFSNRLTVGLITYYGNRGRFACTIMAIPNTPEPTIPPPTCDCGWKQQKRIVGGEETGVNEYPFMCAIIKIPIPSVYCGSVLISNRYALTAAHCVNNLNHSTLGLLVGDHDIETGSETGAAVLYELDGYLKHPQFDKDKFQNDIAIVKTLKEIIISLDVGPVCLPFRYTSYDFTNDYVTALGWGTTEFTGPLSNVLLAANLTVISNAQCRRDLPDSDVIPSQMCTYTPGKDSCQYDSGGPLVWYDSNTRRFQLTSLVSYGIACATDTPAVNTRVSSFLAWIVDETGVNYCVK